MIPSTIDFYNTFVEKFGDELNSMSIGVLSDFIQNKENIESFNSHYVFPNKPSIVLCGINPGRYGAGKTGIPFIDFKSLSKMIPNIKRNDSEKTASFIFKVIENFGISEFFENFYLTNLSCLGFYNMNTNRNINYDALPTPIAQFLLERFVLEMNILKPKIIVPIGRVVNWELTQNLKPNGNIDAKIYPWMYHPASRFAKIDNYIDVLQDLKGRAL